MTAALASLWRWHLASLESMGRSVEAVPGWPHAERFLDQMLDAFAFGLSLIIGIVWLLRWWIALCFVVLVVAT